MTSSTTIFKVALKSVSAALSSVCFLSRSASTSLYRLSSFSNFDLSSSFMIFHHLVLLISRGRRTQTWTQTHRHRLDHIALARHAAAGKHPKLDNAAPDNTGLHEVGRWESLAS